MYKDVKKTDLEFYKLFEIDGTVCPLHSMPGYHCEYYNTGKCVYEDDCIYYPNIDDSRLIRLIVIQHKYDDTRYDVDIKNRDDLKEITLQLLIDKYNNLWNTPYSNKAKDMLKEVREVFGI